MSTEETKEGANTVVIGGKTITIPELNLKALKKIFPLVKKMRVVSPEEVAENAELSMEALDNTVAVLSIALERSETPMKPDEIEDALLLTEIPGLQPALLGILDASGLKVTKSSGEPEAAEVGKEATPSTATSTRSSAKSSAVSEA